MRNIITSHYQCKVKEITYRKWYHLRFFACLTFENNLLILRNARSNTEVILQGVVERFKQTEPKVVISVNAVFYNGKIHCMMSKLEQITKELTTVQKVIVIPFIAEHIVSFPATATNWYETCQCILG